MLKTACFLVSVFLAFTAAQVDLGYYEGDVCKQDGETLWTCKNPKDCPKAREDWMRGIRPLVCSKQKGIPVLCCEPPVKIPPPQLSKSKQMCEEYAKKVFVEVSYGYEEVTYKYDTCTATEPLIVRGTAASPREFPHMALIGIGDGRTISWICGGTLISERFVMSAAHCSLTRRGPVRWVRLGEYNTDTDQDNVDGSALVEDYEIETLINHPDYVSYRMYNDIALYRLKKDVIFNEYVRPACLQTAHQFPKTYAIVTGWGKTDTSSKQSPNLLKVNLTLMQSRECNDYYQSLVGPKLKDGIKDSSQICAGDLISGKDACNGDSGGPLQLRLAEPYCMYSVIGIVSFGPKDCGDRSRPGIYTRVSHFVPWIESIVWP